MSDTLLSRCLAKNIRMTSQRQIIIQVIEESDDHPDVDQLYLRSVELDNTISIATVYRTVKLLEEAGLIERLEFGDGRYWVFSAINFSMRTFEILPGRADREKVQTHKSP